MAFTMIEIALCLAIIGFALVAIIGVLPTGMGVQKDNREETIINQDAVMWLDTIRSGARGHDDLTNYILWITNVVTEFTIGATTNMVPGHSNVYVYSFTSSTKDGVQMNPRLDLTNGQIIIGLLSKPKLEPPNPVAGNFLSNYIVATVRSMSGSDRLENRSRPWQVDLGNAAGERLTGTSCCFRGGVVDTSMIKDR